MGHRNANDFVFMTMIYHKYNPAAIKKNIRSLIY